MQTNKRFKFTFAIASIGYICLGLLMLLYPVSSQKIACYLLGGIAVLLGLVLTAFYFIKSDAPAQGMRYDLAAGVLLLGVGIFLFARPESFMALLPVLLGFSILYDSMVKMQNSFELKRAGLQLWWLFAILSLITTVLGTLLIISPFGATVLLYFFAISLIADGAVNLVLLAVILLFAGKLHRIEKKAAKQAQKEVAAEVSAVLNTDAPEAADTESVDVDSDTEQS